MAKIKWKTRNRGTVTTSLGEFSVVIKKIFKGSISSAVYIDDVKKIEGCDAVHLREQAQEYVEGWK